MLDNAEFFKDAVVGGIPLVLVVFGAVAFLKKWGVTGNALLASSLGIGVILGVPYMMTQTRPPSGDWWVVFVYWFTAAVYGLALGLLASGCYEGIRLAFVSASKMVAKKPE